MKEDGAFIRSIPSALHIIMAIISAGCRDCFWSMGNAERKEPVTLIGPRGLQKVVESLLVIAQGLPFELQYIELTDKEQDLECNGYHLHAFRVNHNVTCYGIR